ncbi:MAG: hypothetical protein IPG02_05290 [Ignavibacteria bacterium]|nr:hypothetical protein [Ignavibacteria bacterium]
MKAWYVFSKESEPSFRYTIDPDSCNVQDLLVVTPWFLSDVLSGNPLLLFPYIELAKYGAEFRNFHWSNSRNSSGNRSSNIIRPPESFRHPYPRSKEEASDKAEHDKGNNFGRIARSGILDNYLSSIKKIDYLGIKISHWMKIFKAMSENKTMQEIDIQLETILRTVKSDIENSQSQKPHLLIFKELLENLNALKENLP